MLKRTAKIIAISLLALGASFLHFSEALATKTYPASSHAFFVNDLANVIDSDTENYIVDTNKSLEAKTGGQIVVMTVKDMDGEAIEDYAHGVFEQYGIGSAEKNNGTLILLSVGDRQSRIELGRGTEGFISDAESGRIQDHYMIPDFKEDNWNDGLRKGFDAVLARYEKEYEIDISESASYEEIADNEDNFDPEGMILLFIFGACFITAKIFKSNKKLRTFFSIFGFILLSISMTFSNAIGIDLATYYLAAGLGLLMGSLFEFKMMLSSGGHYHGGGWSSGGSSSGSSGSHGGGGHSSGGGSSRSF